MSARNLKKWFDLADKIDLQEGLLAYYRYHAMMQEIADAYHTELSKVVAIFCTLSPNNDYTGNLRSTVSILDAFNKGIPFDRVQISTYRHCGERAWRYLTQDLNFLETVDGPKIRNFYRNVLTPDDMRWVTIDGHMVAAYYDKRWTMKEAIVNGQTYAMIAEAVKQFAFFEFLLPNQLQAVIWFTRKRVLNIKYEGNLDMFAPRDDVWRTLREVSSIIPFPLRSPFLDVPPAIRERSLFDFEGGRGET